MSDSLVRVSRRVEWGAYKLASRERRCRSMLEARAAFHNRGDGISRAYRELRLWPPPQSMLTEFTDRFGLIRKQPDSSTTPRGAIGSGMTELSPSLVPPSRGLRPGPQLRMLLQTTIWTTEPPDSKAGLFPIRSTLIRESLKVSFPLIIDMLKLNG
ncbi:hypothetical protein CQW23_29783 [Capsicum baccatum]|uniref:Uncharacterized protein n=1 Tax=Capsicum baccatum TaxID=33114 RepID=A0A2G2VC95_CAPBA|nr:hypothetical protein CQW23_29783 [Capsicum baccatum]